MAGLGRKVFNSGDILLASEVQGYLQDQTVMVFDTAAARGSVIATPTEGMVTYTKDNDAIQVFDGSTYNAVGGGGDFVHISTTTFGTVASQSFDNVFTSDYKQYKIYMSIRNTNDTLVDMRYRVGGSDSTASSYRDVFQYSTSIFNQNPGTKLRISYTSNSSLKPIELTVFNPAHAEFTHHIAQGHGRSTTPVLSFSSGNFEDTTIFDGFSLFPDGGNIVGGYVSIFGLKSV